MLMLMQCDAAMLADAEDAVDNRIDQKGKEKKTSVPCSLMPYSCHAISNTFIGREPDRNTYMKTPVQLHKTNSNKIK